MIGERGIDCGFVIENEGNRNYFRGKFGIKRKRENNKE